ncbi:hypothetical protein H6771_02225 [Candidatus Peribacteria bacterium]|nr:hypothetical protein [Candidatus Peribacteria bacterium]
MLAWLGILLGVIIIWKANAIEQFTGGSAWAERYFGSTITAIQVVGLLISLLSIMWVFGGLQAILSGFFAPFTPSAS